MNPLLRAIAVLAVALGAGFDGFCLVDIARAKEVGGLPRWAWAIICLASTPWGGIFYLAYGKVYRLPGQPRPSYGVSRSPSRRSGNGRYLSAKA